MAKAKTDFEKLYKAATEHNSWQAGQITKLHERIKELEAGKVPVPADYQELQKKCDNFKRILDQQTKTYEANRRQWQQDMKEKEQIIKDLQQQLDFKPEPTPPKNPFNAGRPGQDAETIQKIYEQYLYGLSVRKIAETLGMGKGTIQHILNQQDYIDRGIINQETFDRVKELMQAKRKRQD